MSASPARICWRVGWHADPLAFRPLEIYRWSSRFDDLHRRFRSVYVAERPETSLREVLSDLRPNAAAVRRYVEKWGPAAAADLPARPVTAEWRRTNVLVEVRLVLDGPTIDLCDVAVRNTVEREHGKLLERHGLDHLDLSAITVSRRTVTQTIAAQLHDHQNAAAIRFPSKHDGGACLAVFEGRGELVASGEPVALTDPAPRALIDVCAGWDLALGPDDTSRRA